MSWLFSRHHAYSSLCALPSCHYLYNMQALSQKMNITAKNTERPRIKIWRNGWDAKHKGVGGGGTTFVLDSLSFLGRIRHSSAPYMCTTNWISWATVNLNNYVRHAVQGSLYSLDWITGLDILDWTYWTHLWPLYTTLNLASCRVCQFNFASVFRF